MKQLDQGATIGIVGGGQLARMLVVAAAQLGFRCHIFSQRCDDCALPLVQNATIASFDDERAFLLFAQQCDVITYETENVPPRLFDKIADANKVFPRPKVLSITQERLAEKMFLRNAGIEIAPFLPLDSDADVSAVQAMRPFPVVLKTRRLGYDGKGQSIVHSPQDLTRARASLGDAPCVAEQYIKFELEISVVVARSADGSTSAFEPVENLHRDHILRKSIVPARISRSEADEAIRTAEAIARELDYIGVLAVEMFVVRKGPARVLLVNELAPRVHNSGHWTIEGAATSQFEQHIRAIANWPLGSASTRAECEMTNLIGDEVQTHQIWLSVPDASVHLYGKHPVVAGRKMGHVTRVLGPMLAPMLGATARPPG